MLRNLGEHIQDCHVHASDCRKKAAREADQTRKHELLDMEARWLHLAQNYAFLESLERFLLDAEKNRRSA
jgi:hypothetical protein